MVRMVCPTATAARFFPRRATSRWNCAVREVGDFFPRPAAWARLTKAARSQATAFAGLGTGALAGALVVAGAHPRPGGQMLRRGEAAQVRPHTPPPGPPPCGATPGWCPAEQGSPRKGAGARGAGAERSTAASRKSMCANCCATRNRWCVPTPTRQRPLQLRQLLPWPAPAPARPGRARPSRRPPAREHLSAGHAQDVAGHRRQLDVRALQRLLQPVGLGRALADERGRYRVQLPQARAGALRHEAGPQQAVRNRSAIHSQSRTSVFRPGTCLTMSRECPPWTRSLRSLTRGGPDRHRNEVVQRWLLM